MLNKQELIFIHAILKQLNWKTGQSKDTKMAEDICEKITIEHNKENKNANTTTK